ncbi:phage tail protein [Campylobacter coli]|uniref:Phage tail protein n=2 Tax=Campylobacter TaxID=194 RepID=A0A5Y9K6D3_CAMJU|nr:MULTISPECIES: tail protein X [Campylobacter]EEJ8926697.1 phage tail protein [Salmonella enterica subsp. enterica]EIB05707.1 tail protein X, putative [Campylobacter coli H6]MIJ59486.1 phage tail protein [Salmonella enterica subsp. enterica serovar Enteritidis]WKW83125.1 tail protein [Campylobacter phage CAM-P21]ALG96368.1 tail protein [Campylobacter coli]
MSKIYIAKNNERLDSIVYKHYGTLLYFNQVLLANPKLEPLLKTGDKVVLPSIEIKESKEKALW